MRRKATWCTLALLFSVLSCAQAASPATVTVRRGDTLFKLSVRHHTTVDALRRANGIRGNLIRVGQRLRLPGKAAPAATAKAAPPKPSLVTKTVWKTVPYVVRVRKGDTLAVVAARHGLGVRQLKRLNKLRNDTLFAGQALVVGTRAERATLAVSPAPPRAPGESVRLVRATVLGVPVTFVEVDLRDPGVLVTALLPNRGLGTGGSFGRMAAASGARAVINGSYFHPRTYIPVGDLVVQGRHLFDGRAGVALAVTPDNRVNLQPAAQKNNTWRGFETVIAGGPHILRGSRVVVRPFQDGFRDPAIFNRAARSVLGITKGRRLVLLSTKTKISQNETAKIMQRLGVTDAVMLDGGSSTGLAWRGQSLISPARKIAYGIAVYVNYKGRRYVR